METVSYLDPNQINFIRDAGGLISVKINDQVYHEVSVHRTFPRKHPFKYISIRDINKQELGLIHDLADLDQSSEQMIKQELQIRYLIPKVRKILSIKQEPGLWTLEFLTDRGKIEFYIRNVHDHIKADRNGRIMIKEHDNRQVYIENLNELDKKSIRLFRKIL
ncbi:MAG: DUF1854 domain-containing protein [Erysipelothrix sp.]|nr:DUF1854 domain-containing protein [Erysipelothrix sp.]